MSSFSTRVEGKDIYVFEHAHSEFGSSVEGQRLRILNVRWRSTAPHGGQLSEAELRGVPVADGWCHGRRCTCLSSLCRSWVLVACIACVMIVIGVHGPTEWWVSISTYLYSSRILTAADDKACRSRWQSRPEFSSMFTRLWKDLQYLCDMGSGIVKMVDLSAYFPVFAPIEVKPHFEPFSPVRLRSFLKATT
jgi:hypothetical protein